jgi:isopenicillin-N epimerase
MRRLPDLLAAARARLGAYLGAAPNDLVFVPNATTGVNIVARSLDLAPGDVVLGTDHEYGACDRAMRFVCAQRGAEYRRVVIPTPVLDPDAIVDAVAEALETRPRLFMVSHITSATALVFPVAAICAAARAAGVPILVDGAHGPGQVPLDLDSLGADYYTGNCHKWLCAPKGAGFLHARPDAQHRLEPLVVSWGWEPEVPGISPFQDELGWTGTRDPAAYLAIQAAIDFQAEHDWENVRAACHELVRFGRAGMLAVPGIEPLHPDDPAWYAQMEAVLLPPCDPLALADWLWTNRRVEVPGVVWNERAIVRISIQAYNTREDVERFLEALPEALAAVRSGLDG